MLLTRRQSLMAGASFVATAWAAKNVLAQGEVSGAQKDAIDKVLRQAVERGDVPGVVVAVTDRERTIYEGAFGERGLGGGVPMTTDTVFYLASMTKPITATCAMQLVEQGKLELDAPISKYVPETKQKLQVLEGWDDKGQPKLRPPKREITLRDLNTHSSGFVYNLWDADFDRYMKETKLPGLELGQGGGLVPAADVRSGRAVGVRHLDRLDRAAGPGGEREVAGHLHAGPCLRAAGHDQHGLRDLARHGEAPGHLAPARCGGQARGHRLEEQAGPTGRERRRRALLDHGRLSALHAHDPQQGEG